MADAQPDEGAHMLRMRATPPDATSGTTLEWSVEQLHKKFASPGTLETTSTGKAAHHSIDAS